MRPARLEVEGFTAYRDRTVVDFEGVDLFALVGPTGAGKTSIIDAVTFALYGSVPRLDDQRQVAPVISQGLVEAKVRLDFTVAGRPHVVVRVVRATKKGATTKEARLEGPGGELLAGDAAAVTAAIESLLGLDFRQFTTCVSLPQGDFARFLHDKPRDRQDLLVRLLDLGLYEAVRQAAQRRREEAIAALALAEARLADLAHATPEAIAAAQGRVDALGALAATVQAAEPRLAAHAAGAQAADEEAQRASGAVELLAAVVVPAGTDALAASVATAAASARTAREGEEQAEGAVAEAEKALAAHPPVAELDDALRAFAEHERLHALVEKGTVALAAAAAAVGPALSLEAERAAVLAAARAAEVEARTTHAAHALAGALAVGEPCPVCRQAVRELPVFEPGHVEEASAAVARADEAHRAAREAADAARAEHARVAGKLDNAHAELAAAADRVRALPPRDDVEARRAARASAEAALAEARKALGQAAQARRAAQDALDTASAAETEARRRFDQARDRVAAFGPPPAAHVDLAADWTALAAWAAERRPALEADATEARARAETARAALAAELATIAEACAALGVEVQGAASPAAAVAAAGARAEAELARLQQAVADVERLGAEVAAGTARRAVAETLATHLKADRFEQWLLDEVLQLLVAGATEILRELSGGAYSLVLDEQHRTFAVIDHVNADAERSARTLSGGETFLASLALALAVADQVAALGTGSAWAGRLETILIDEGFGTLDADTLDVVATALEELGARGRMVGVVSHVRELAERLPVRFEVRKVGPAATVERVEAGR